MVQYFLTVESSQLKHDTKSRVFSEYYKHLARETIPQIVSHKIQQGLRDNIVNIFHIFPVMLSVKVCDMTSLTAGTGEHVSGTGRMRL